MASDVLNSLVAQIRAQMPRIQAGANRGIDEALSRARKWADEADLGLAKDAVVASLDRVEQSKPALEHLSGVLLANLLERVYFGVGATDDTRMAYFPSSAGFDEARRAMHELTLAKSQRKVARDEAWDEFKAMLRDVGKLALQAVVPVLLAAI